jgi:phosphate transport system permease protein
MTDTVVPPSARAPADHTSDAALARLNRRYAAEARFKWYGIIAIGVALAMLVILLTSIVSRGLPAFQQTYVTLEVPIASDLILADADYRQLVVNGLRQRFPDVRSPSEIRDLGGMINDLYPPELQTEVIGNPDLIGQTINRWVPASRLVDMIHEGDIYPGLLDRIRATPTQMLEYYDMLRLRGAISLPGAEEGEVPPDARTQVVLPIETGPGFDPATADYDVLVNEAIGDLLVAFGPAGTDLSGLAGQLLAPGAAQSVAAYLRDNPDAASGEEAEVPVPASERIDQLHRSIIDENLRGRLADIQQKLRWHDALVEQGAIEIRQGFTYINVDIPIDADFILGSADYQTPIYRAIYELFPEVDGRSARRELRDMISPGGGFRLRDMVLANPELIGQTITMQVALADSLDQVNKGAYDLEEMPERRWPISPQQLAWFERLEADGRVTTAFNVPFFTQADSRQPELAGIWGAAVGSFYTLVVTLALAFPIGVSAAIYLEEFAPKNRITDLIEVNINNLAAVPSIVFGLLGLAVFIQFFGLPRSAPLVGGMVLALMTLPTIIIASRAALKAVPPSIREAALGMGASKLQSVLHHVLPLAMPGILTGTIIGMAQALGETAPLLMIGMVAFITSTPEGFTDPATVLPVQIYLWSDSPERGFTAKTSAAIMVLLAFLIMMNGLAIWLRKKFERRW